jgi:hypothetical protein
MSNSVAIADLADLVKDGQLGEAKRQARTLLSEADPHDLQVVARCAYVLESWPKIGVVKLRAYWQNSNEHDRAIIAACAPGNGAQRRHSEPEGKPPRWTRKTTYQAPRDERHEVRADRRRVASRRTRDDGAAIMDAYQRERAGVDDEPLPADPAAGYELDYDRAAMSPFRGTPCVCCWLERATRDRTTGHDDGLCGECRDRGRPGIPRLPEGHTGADLIASRCAYLASRYPTVALLLLRRYWQQSTSPHDRDVIAAWVGSHDLTAIQNGITTTGQEPASDELTVCASCGDPRTSRDLRHVRDDDGLCLQCRAASTDEAREPQLAAV